MKPLLIANWKMHFTAAESARLARALQSKFPRNVDVVLAPSFPNLAMVGEAIREKNFSLGAQDVFYESSGAYTGEVSAGQLKQFGVQYVLVGHSERRTFFGETDAMIARKMQACVAAKLIPVLLVGDRAADRQSGTHDRVVRNQLQSALQFLTRCPRMVISYEPVWAISTSGGGRISPEEVRRMTALLRGVCIKRWSESTVARSVRFVYGGSVNASNVARMIDGALITGALVGAASLKTSSLLATANQLKETSKGDTLELH